MTDLRTAAQAVIDWIDADPKTKMLCSGCPEFVALRQALAEPEPSVDALIAEAVAKEREACAELCDYLSNREYGVYSDSEREDLHNEASRHCAEAIRARGQK